MAWNKWVKTTRNQRDEMRNTVDASTVGWMFVAAIVLGYLAGLWVDKVFSVSPWGSVVGVLLGVIVGFINLIQVSNRIVRDEDEAQRRRKGDAGHPPDEGPKP